MSQKTFWRGVLVGLVCLALATFAHAQAGSGKPLISYKGSNTAVAGGAAAGAAGIVSLITILVTHKKEITGCVTALTEGMNLTDEHDKQTYELMGSTTDFKPGDRVRIQVKRIKSTDKGSAPVWRVGKLIKNYGSCEELVGEFLSISDTRFLAQVIETATSVFPRATSTSRIPLWLA